MSWYLTCGPEQDVILSSRVRLARNVDTYPFTDILTINRPSNCPRKFAIRFTPRIAKCLIYIEIWT